MRVLFLYLASIACLGGAVTHAHGADQAGYWQRIDQNHDGVIDESEYLQWMMYGFTQRDRNGDHVLNGDELPTGSAKPITETQQRHALKNQFHAQDRDGDNVLTPSEFLAPPR